MQGWMNRCIDGWTDGLPDRWRNRQINQQMDILIEREGEHIPLTSGMDADEFRKGTGEKSTGTSNTEGEAE